MQTDLSNVKAGDWVVVSRGIAGNEVKKVERTTATQVIVGGLKYTRFGGALIGGGKFNRSRLFVPSAEYLEQQTRAYYWKRIQSATPDFFQSVSTEKLRDFCCNTLELNPPAWELESKEKSVFSC